MLIRWARKLQGTPQVSDPTSSAPHDRLPVLPNRRPETLTPPPPTSNATAQTCVANDSSQLFAAIPFDVRQQIIFEAFGGQTIHIDLVYDRPRDGPPTKDHRSRRAPRPTAEERRSASALHKLKPKRWRWYSCVCHADLPRGTNPWSRMAEPCNDSCAGAEIDHFCTAWPGEAPHKCFIGIMGWLLTCRQAYVEGMDILWKTNTFRIQDMTILRYSQQLFLPHRWATIPRLEIKCFFSPYGWMWPATTGPPVNPLPPYCHKASFHELMDHSPSALCNLHTLHLSLQSTTTRPFVDSEAAALAELMKPVEGMLRRLPSTIRECTIAVPSSLYRPSRDDAIRDGRVVEHFCKKQRERHWRELSGPTEGLDGYWLQLGKTDLSPFAIMPVACFGTGGNWSWRDHVDIEQEDLILYGLRW